MNGKTLWLMAFFLPLYYFEVICVPWVLTNIYASILYFMAFSLTIRFFFQRWFIDYLTVLWNDNLILFRLFFHIKGPKLFKRLTGKSNKAAILNSLNHRVLAGVVNANVRKQVIDVSVYFAIGQQRNEPLIHIFYSNMIEGD